MVVLKVIESLEEQVTIKKIPLVSNFDKDGEKFLVVKGSLPGARNGKLKFLAE